MGEAESSGEENEPGRRNKTGRRGDGEERGEGPFIKRRGPLSLIVTLAAQHRMHPSHAHTRAPMFH